MPHADPPPDARRVPRPRLERRLVLAWAALLWERLWPGLWPAVGVLGVFLAFALFDLPSRLPALLHVAFLAAAAGLLGWAVYWFFKHFDLPDRGAARRRIETASGLVHRPLATLEDRLAGDGSDPETAALWQAHRARMAAAARRLRVGAPVAGLLRRDPYALRAALALVLVLGVIDAGSDWGDRILRSLSPGLAPGAGAAAVTLDIWVSPPDYTGLPPQFLQANATAAAIPVPTGSFVLAQVHGSGGVPNLTLDDHATPFARIDDSNFKGSATITAGQRLAVTQDGKTLGAWPIKVVPDLPPTITFAKPPQATNRGALRLEYHANDDYGVEAVKAQMRLKDDPNGATLTLDLPLPGQHLKDATAASFHDLTPHPWAGLPVELKLQAADALNQIGESETIETVLPERVFHHPVARAIIEARKELTRHPDDKRPVAETLSDLSMRPGLFNGDIVAFMALRTAQARLILDRDSDTIAAVQQLMWDTALRIEDGRTSTSQRDLRQAMQALQDALARNAPDAEIARLMQEVQQAIDRYLQAMAQQMQRQPNDQQMQPIDPSKMISRQDLQRMLDKARDLAKTGSRDQARDLLARLQEMLENLRMAQPGQMQSGSGQAMRQMDEMMRRQQQLLDRSFRRSRQGQQGQQGQQRQQGQQGQQGQRGQQGQQGQGQQGQGQQGGDGDDAGEQDSVRRMLGDMMQQLGEQGGDLPAPMARADRAMRNAVEALKRAQPGQAIGPQTEALDALQQAARDMAEKMMGRNGNPQEGGDPGDREGMDQAKRDPFGRMNDENGNGGVNDGGLMRSGRSANDYAVEKAKEILEELRQRAGERSRPEIEHDYIDRLLKQF